MKNFLTFFSFLIISCVVFSQETILTIQQAIETALKNNYDIKIIANVSEQAKNNNTPGNAGMLPEIDANGSYTRSSNSLKQKYNNGLEVDRDASVSTNAIADLGANWTIFDGMKMFHTKNKFSELSMQSRDQLKIQIENSLQEVISSYYAIVRHQQLLKSMREELLFSDERVKISDRKSRERSRPLPLLTLVVASVRMETGCR